MFNVDPVYVITFGVNFIVMIDFLIEEKLYASGNIWFPSEDGYIGECLIDFYLHHHHYYYIIFYCIERYLVCVGEKVS